MKPRDTETYPHRRRTIALLLFLCPFLFAMQCANEDLTRAFTLQLTNDQQPESLTIDLPYTGRISLDVGIDAENSGEVSLRTQVQTSGDPDIEGCDAFESRRSREIGAAPWNGNDPPIQNNQTYPTLSNVRSRTQFILPYQEDLDAYAGAVELATDHALVRVYSTSDDLSLWDLNGNIVPPIHATQPATCEQLFVTVYEMPRDNVRIAYRSDTPSVEQVIVADCAEDRVVDRVCPGSYTDIDSHTFTVESNTRHVERYPLVGVGDTIVVESSCDGACPATVELYAWIEPLQCRTRNDCSGGRSCSHDGYCIKEPPPSCAISTRPSVWMIFWAVLILLAPRLRKRKRRGIRPC